MRRSSRFLLMSAECATLCVRSLSVYTPFAPGFGCSWPMSSCFSLERVCHGVFGFPVLPLPTFTPKIDAACARLRWSVAFPLPLEVASHYHDVLFVCSLPYFIIRHTVSTHSMQYSPFHFRWHVWSIFFPSSWAIMFGHRTKGPGKHRIPENLSVSLVSGICRPVKTRPLNFLQATAILFYIYFPELSRNEIFRPCFLLILLTNFIILMNDVQYSKSIYRPKRCSAYTIPWMTCLKGLERK